MHSFRNTTMAGCTRHTIFFAKLFHGDPHVRPVCKTLHDVTPDSPIRADGLESGYLPCCQPPLHAVAQRQTVDRRNSIIYTCLDVQDASPPPLMHCTSQQYLSSKAGWVLSVSRCATLGPQVDLLEVCRAFSDAAYAVL